MCEAYFPAKTQWHNLRIPHKTQLRAHIILTIRHEVVNGFKSRGGAQANAGRVRPGIRIQLHVLLPTITVLQKGSSAVQGGPKPLSKVLSGAFLAGPYFEPARDKAVHQDYRVMMCRSLGGELKARSFLFLCQIVQGRNGHGFVESSKLLFKDILDYLFVELELNAQAFEYNGGSKLENPQH